MKIDNRPQWSYFIVWLSMFFLGINVFMSRRHGLYKNGLNYLQVDEAIFFSIIILISSIIGIIYNIKYHYKYYKQCEEIILKIIKIWILEYLIVAIMTILYFKIHQLLLLLVTQSILLTLLIIIIIKDRKLYKNMEYEFYLKQKKHKFTAK